MDERTIKRALKALLREADELDHEAAKRRLAASHLEALLPPDAQSSPKAASSMPAANGTGRPPRTSEGILQVMREAGGPLSLDDIRSAFARKGWKVPSSLHETIRRLKVSEKIEWVGFGTYVLSGLNEDSGTPALSRSSRTTPE